MTKNVTSNTSGAKGIVTIVTALRDLFIHLSPKFLVRVFIRKGEFAFLAHPLDLPDLVKYYPFASKFSKRWLKLLSRYHWPVIGSKITGFTDSMNRRCEGWVVYCPFTARMLILKRATAIKRLIQAVRFIEKLDVKMIGLGAFVPIVTDDGHLLKEKTPVKIVSGASYSAAIGLQNTTMALNKIDLDISDCLPAVVGAAGSVGRLVSQLYATRFKKLLLIDKNKQGLEQMARLVKKLNTKVRLAYTTSINAISDADIVFVSTNTPGAIVHAEYIKPGAIVIDGAHPRNASAKIPRQRQDVIVIESGIAEIDRLNTNTDFGLRNQNEVYSCLAEVLLLLWKPALFANLAEESLAYVEALLKYSPEAGIRPALFRNQSGYITDDTFVKIARIRESLVIRKTVG